MFRGTVERPSSNTKSKCSFPVYRSLARIPELKALKFPLMLRPVCSVAFFVGFLNRPLFLSFHRELDLSLRLICCKLFCTI